MQLSQNCQCNQLHAMPNSNVPSWGDGATVEGAIIQKTVPYVAIGIGLITLYILFKK